RDVFEPVDAGRERVGDRLRTVRVRHDRQAEPVRLVDRGAQLGRAELGLLGVKFPPLAMILMTSTPCSACSRTAARMPSTPSAGPPRKWQCPPGVVIGGPAATIVGNVRSFAAASRSPSER